MKKYKFIIVIFLSCLFFSLKVNAIEADFKYTNDFKNWLKLDEITRVNTVVPDSVDAIIVDTNNGDDIWNDKNNMIVFDIQILRNKLILGNRFNLADKIDIEIKNQGDTEECWAFSTFTSMESNLLYKKGIKKDFSERHMDYSTSNSFYNTDTLNQKYRRLVSFGGKTETALAYLTNGQGAVLENEMPFENNKNIINVEDIEIQPSYYVTDYQRFPSIIKKFDSKGNIKYFDSYGNELSLNQVLSIRNKIKQYIANYGSIVSVTSAGYSKGYNNSNKFKAQNYFCKDSYQIKDHSITIIGWDDNYKKENFKENNQPKSDGAYIVLQTYSDKAFDNGYIYISYEDIFIENNLIGICNSKKYDYDKLYQKDYYGANGILTVDNYNTCYYATTFDRDTSKDELLKQISVTIAEESNIEIWINPKGKEINKNNLIKVSNVKKLSPGFHTIEIDPVNLTNNNFSIVIKQITNGKESNINIEYKTDDVFYPYVDSTNQNYISIDGNKWINIIDLIKSNEKKDYIKTADFCIKAYTKNK